MSIMPYTSPETADAVRDLSANCASLPSNGSHRPALMAALALAEHLVAAQVPMPTSLTIESPLSDGREALVNVYAHHDIAVLGQWQQAFGGVITHKLVGEASVHSYLDGRVYDGPFRVVTVRQLSPERQVDERRLTAQWVAEHGVRDDWAPETLAAYLREITNFRVAVAQ